MRLHKVRRATIGLFLFFVCYLVTTAYAAQITQDSDVDKAQTWLIVAMFGLLQTVIGAIFIYLVKDIKGSIRTLFDHVEKKADDKDVEKLRDSKMDIDYHEKLCAERVKAK